MPWCGTAKGGTSIRGRRWLAGRRQLAMGGHAAGLTVGIAGKSLGSGSRVCVCAMGPENEISDILDAMIWQCDRWWCGKKNAGECKRAHVDGLMVNNPGLGAELQELLDRHGRLFSELYQDCLCVCHSGSG